MSRIAAALMLIALHNSVLSGQSPSYFWPNDQGKVQQSHDFAAVPKSAYAAMECRIKGITALSGDTIEVEGGHAIRLIGLREVTRGSAKLALLPKKRLTALIAGKVLRLRFDHNFKDANYRTWAYVWAEAEKPTSAPRSQDRFLPAHSINARLINEGLACARDDGVNTRYQGAMIGAENTARTQKRGIWRLDDKLKKKPTLDPKRTRRGFSLGLYSRQADFDYRPFLRELVELGATDLMLITPWFLADYKSTTISAHKHRTTPLAYVERCAAQAKKLGFKVTLMPIVLLKDGGDDYWRGNIEPQDIDDWFGSYLDFILPFAEIAERQDCEALLIGSEFSSLEEHDKHWRTMIRGVRRRFSGLLSYSANWDHIDSIPWWDDLDFISMTGYHSLTEKDDPSIAELKAGWDKVRRELMAVLKPLKKPFIFSEMGYASLDGINKNPWDYVSPEVVDYQEQADCYRAFIAVWSQKTSGYCGAFFYTWWRNNDDEDQRQYSVYGKPAEKIIRAYFRQK